MILFTLLLLANTDLLETKVTGYLDLRSTYNHVLPEHLFSTRDVPTFHELVEGNVQLQLRFKEYGFILGDASFVYQKGLLFYEQVNGDIQQVGNHDVEKLRPFAVINELYGSYNFNDNANITLGKKRIVFGPGFAINPTDLLNPPKDPTDPTQQRAGAWLLRFEFPFEKFTATFLAAGQVMQQYSSIPTSLLFDHNEAFYLLTTRFYALWADTDFNLMYNYDHGYNQTTPQHSLGLTAAKYVTDSWELHGEILIPFYANARPEALLGTRYNFIDESFLNIEYLYHGKGFDEDDFATTVFVLKQAKEQNIQVVPNTTNNTGSPQRFVFQPLRRHYLFATYSKPRIYDDFTVNLSLIANLSDYSGQFVPGAVWSATEWLNVTLLLFAPLPRFIQNTTPVDGQNYSEYDVTPVDYRVVLSARAFY